MKDFWDKRYSDEAFAYGELPNEFLKENVVNLPKGKILFPAEGEGRNAVFAAGLGWEVSAFDISEEGRRKALLLAERNQVSIDYQVVDIHKLDYEEESFDAMALIYAHFPADVKSEYHKLLVQYLRKGGLVIFEAFSKNHLMCLAENEKVGGPKDVNMLFSVEEIAADFVDFDVILLDERKIELHEGLYHNGVGSVVRFLGRKK